MTQALLYSIAPQHLVTILNGLKTIEVRKRDLPQWAKDKLARGEKVIGYGYCTKGKPYLINHPYHSYMLIDDKTFDNLNGRVVVKFEVSGVSKIDNEPYHDDWLKFGKQACLDEEQWYQYFTWSKDGGGYAHHITNIQPVNMELGEFISDKLVINVCGNEYKCYSETASYFARKDQRLTKAPQSFMTCWVKGE